MSAPEAPARSLHRKLAQIMYEAERIPKNGQAPREMGGFKFVQVGDAADFIRKALAEKVLTMMPTRLAVVGQSEHGTKSGGSMTTVDVLMDWTITDGESGESIVIQSFGAGADGGDKYSGKAQTNAMKYALLMGFLLSTGDDPEGNPPNEPEEGGRRTARPPRAASAPATPTTPPAIPEAEVDALTAPDASTYCWAEDVEMDTGHCALAPGHDGPHKNRGGVWPQ